MATFNDWDIVQIPRTPPAPASIDFFFVDIVSQNRSPFTGQQQIYKWGGKYMEAAVNLPPLKDLDAQEWLAFLINLEGVANVFQFSPEFTAAYPQSIGTRYWRLKSNTRKWAIGSDRMYRISFEVTEAL